MKRAIYSGGSFKPLDPPDLSEGGEMIVLLDVPRQNRRRPYVRCRFEGELLVPDAPVTTLQDGEEVEYYEAVVAEIIAPGISRHANVRFGKACIEGTRLAVMDIAPLHNQGLTPEEILVEYPDVTLEQIGHALAYYRAHPEEIAAEFERQERAFDEMERQWEEYAARHGGNPPEVPGVEDRGIARPVDARNPVDVVGRARTWIDSTGDRHEHAATEGVAGVPGVPGRHARHCWSLSEPGGRGAGC